MKIRLAADLQSDSIVDGDGIRTVIWTQGCPHNCLACHNPDTHDFNGGLLIENKEIIEKLKSLKNQTGITFSGGDPMCQPDACLEIALWCKKNNLNIWCYTGYEFEQLIEMSKTKPVILDFLKQIDILVDGKFILALKSYNVRYRGSKNQRIIDVKKSLESGHVVEDLQYKEKENILKDKQPLYI